MSGKLEKITKEKFEEAKGIVTDSHCSLTDYYDEYGMFRINAESKSGTTVILNCRVIKSVIMGYINISYEIRIGSDTVYDTTVSEDKQDYGIVEFHKVISDLDKRAQKEFKDYSI